jgi:antitoxin MazE
MCNITAYSFFKSIMQAVQTRLSTWGRSVAVRIPSRLVRSHGWTAGQEMQVQESDDGSITLRPMPIKLNLDDLLARITPENMHADISWGKPVGTEAW